MAAITLDRTRHFGQIFGQTDNGAVFTQDGYDFRGDGTIILSDEDRATIAAVDSALAEQAAAEQAAAEQAAAEQAAAEQAAAEQAAAKKPKSGKAASAKTESSDDEDLA